MLRSLVLAVLGFGAAAWLEPKLQPLPEATNGDASTLRLPALVLRTASAGYEALLSDWYWLEAIQYFGTEAYEANHYSGLAPYLTAAVDLDPEFDFVYQFGGEVLPTRDHTTKLWYNTGAAIELLERGMESSSTRWQIPVLLAYCLYTYRGDYTRAGHILEQAANRPRAPRYLSGFAAKLLAAGGSADTAIEFAQSQLQRAIDQRTRDDLLERLRALYLQKDLATLNRAAKERLATGLPLDSVENLVGYAGLTQIPPESFGGTFRISGDKVVSSDDEKLLHLFVHANNSLMEPTAN
jgi:tetratricopeptide (TPR) repeat protein